MNPITDAVEGTLPEKLSHLKYLVDKGYQVRFYDNVPRLQYEIIAWHNSNTEGGVVVPFQYKDLSAIQGNLDGLNGLLQQSARVHAGIVACFMQAIQSANVGGK